MHGQAPSAREEEDQKAFFHEEGVKEESRGSAEERATKETLYERLQEFDNQEDADENDDENIDLADFRTEQSAPSKYRQNSYFCRIKNG